MLHSLQMFSILGTREKNIEHYLRQLYRNSYQVEVDKFNIVIKNMYQLYATTAPSSSKRRAYMAVLAAN